MEIDKNVKIGLLLAAVLVASLFAYKSFSFDTPNQEPQEQKEKITTLEWTQLASSTPWAPRDSAAGFVFQDKIWIAGGLNGNGLVTPSRTIKYWEAPHFNDIWNSADGTNWSKVETKNIWPVRRSMSIIEYKGKLWMMGGWSPSSGYSRDIWNSPDGANWTRATTTPAWEAREGQSVEIFGGKLWLMGGVNYDLRKVFNDVWYSEDGLNWVLATNSAPWAPRWDNALTIFQDKFYLAGGMDLKNNTYEDVWTSTDGASWLLVSEAAPWEARQGHSLISMSDTLWIFGRLNDDKINPGPNDIWNTKDGINWQKVGDLPWDGREDFNSLILADKLYVFAGMGNDWIWRNDVWLGTFKVE